MELENAMNEDPIECEWLDQEREIMGVLYSNWDGMELWAILKKGRLVRKGISQIVSFLADRELAIVKLQGRYITSAEQIEYNASDDDERVGVIHTNGNFHIEPIYSWITYEPKEGKFYCQRMNGKEDIL